MSLYEFPWNEGWITIQGPSTWAVVALAVAILVHAGCIVYAQRRK